MQEIERLALRTFFVNVDKHKLGYKSALQKSVCRGCSNVSAADYSAFLIILHIIPRKKENTGQKLPGIIIDSYQVIYSRKLLNAGFILSPIQGNAQQPCANLQDVPRVLYHWGRA